MSREIKADFCIVGAGIAGALVASRLAASGKSIVMIDQGPRYTEADRINMLMQAREALNDFADYNDDAEEGSVTPHTTGEDVPWEAWRLFGLGGTALHYEGLMIRPMEADLQVRTLFGYGRNWPITYGELEPWLLEAERETGVAGNEDNPYASPRSGPFPMEAHPFSYFDREIFLPALERLNIVGHSCPRAINSREYEGRSPCMACRACKFCPSGARYSPDRVHIPRLEQQQNVRIVSDTSLRRLETNRSGTRITSAHAVGVQDKAEVVIKAPCFVLAMGGVETARMLMLSTGPGQHAEGIGNAGGQLGQGFSDHLNPLVSIDVGRPVGGRLGFETLLSDHFRAGVDRREEPSYLIIGAPAIDWDSISEEATLWATRDGVLSLQDLRRSITRIASIWTMTELRGQGTLLLDPDQLDEFGSPVARVSMKLTDWDRKAVTQMSRLAGDLAEAMDARNVSEVTPVEFGLGFHPSGATAMAADADSGVCDRNLRVFGLENLYLVSNSVFPHMGANPPTLTIAALALRLGAHLGGRSK